jgi:hypothetical protein|tara:strand:+ start:1749 stop:2603 length:855 start_codon:yes stop_codon:yes gene_type:complete
MKLNIGASPIWDCEGWTTLDHKFRKNTEFSIMGDAANMPMDNNTCDTIFCSHMFEHVPNVKLEEILLEFNRTLQQDGIVRILTPDLKKIATAYVNEDKDFFRMARLEDTSIRTDLGLGGQFINFIISQGQDTALFNRNIDEFIVGYAHLYSYDFNMLKILLERTGFHLVEQKEFCESSLTEYRVPLHVQGMEPKWQNFNQKFYDENNLVHEYDPETGGYNINFRVTGFDRDPLTSLIIEARKKEDIPKTSYHSLNDSNTNYCRYGWSLLKDPAFAEKVKKIEEL